MFDWGFSIFVSYFIISNLFYSSTLFEPLIASISYIFDNCKELLTIGKKIFFKSYSLVNENIEKLKVNQDESESSIDELQHSIDQELTHFLQTSKQGYF